MENLSESDSVKAFRQVGRPDRALSEKQERGNTDAAIEELLGRRIDLPDIKAAVGWALKERHNMERLYSLTKSADQRLSVNALRCLSHLPRSEAGWLQALQSELIDRLLAETHTAKRRILFRLLREQTYEREAIRTDFLDHCLSNINSAYEPCAIRCFSIRCAFKMCRFHPELIAELTECLDMLSTRSLPPGIQCALRTARTDINRLNSQQRAL